MKMGSLVEVGLLLQRPSLASADTSLSWLLPKISTDGGVMLKPGSVGPLLPGGACYIRHQEPISKQSVRLTQKFS